MTMQSRWSAAVAGLVAAVMVSAGGNAEAQQQDLKQVYKREFAFLEAEKSALQKRLKELEQEKSQKLGAAKAEIDKIQGGIMRSALESERLSELLYDAERSVEGVEESADMLDRTLRKIRRIQVPAPGKLPDHLDFLFIDMPINFATSARSFSMSSPFLPITMPGRAVKIVILAFFAWRSIVIRLTEASFSFVLMYSRS